jgi:hypothetical protein
VSGKSQRHSRILGLETEYGCLMQGMGGRSVQRIRDWFFERHHYGLVDRHDRGWDEPPGNGGFLFNGGRLYVDMGHLEYCTPECVTLEDVVRYDRAGDRMLLAALEALELTETVHFIRNNIDHHTGATFGCHENYSLLRTAPLTVTNVQSLLTFLTLRVLFTGSGRVGEKRNPGEPDKTGIEFQISQRADYIETELYEWVQHNRAIINTRDEPLADPRLYRRLHLLHGDTHVLPSALYLKVGTTRLMLDLLELDDLPVVALADAVDCMRELSRCLRPPWRIRLQTGSEADALEVLSRFRLRAKSRFAGRDQETDAVLALWARVEAGLAADRDSLVGVIDWITKQHLLDSFRRQERLKWNDPWLEAQDLEYHQVDPARSLGLALADLSGPWARGLEDESAMLAPPKGTRAAIRSARMRRIAATDDGYEIDWHRVEQTGGETILLLDPFQTKLS